MARTRSTRRSGPDAGAPDTRFLGGAAGGDVIAAATADVGRTRERQRRRRVLVLLTGLALLGGYFAWAWATGRHTLWTPPGTAIEWFPFIYLGLLVVAGVGYYVLSGRSPHTVIQPNQVGVRLRDVVGVDGVKDEVTRSLNLFLSHRTFAETMGGRPRRGLLFEGAPGTGKTLMAKAMAAEAGVPFLFATATSFQSSFYGATARRIRSFFKELRKVARANGGAIAFIDEFDAIGGRRSGLEMREAPSAASAAGALCCGGLDGLAPSTTAFRPEVSRLSGTSDLAGPVVNELLVQMQSFDTPVGLVRLLGKLVDRVNLLLPAHRQLRGPSQVPANLLVIAATNRADGLDPALLRPGRFDRRLAFELPTKSGRRALVDHFLATKAHDTDLATGERRDALAAVTTGYSPAMLEGLLDEGLINAVRRGSVTMSWGDVESARLTSEVGLGQPVAYTDYEKRLIATHEAGHTVVAWLVAPQRRLEVLSIIKRRDALGLLAHGDREDVFTRSRGDLLAFIQIALGGQTAEELFFGDVSTGPASDLLQATRWAAEMVGSSGMEGSLVSWRAVEATPFSADFVGRVLGDGASRARVESLLEQQKAVVRTLLGENRHLVEALRDALTERSELVGSQITDVLDAARAGRPAEAQPAAPRHGGVIDLRPEARPRT